MKRICPTLALASLALTASAQLDAPTPTPLFGARNLALSPDGKSLAFSYQGDVWVAPATGGKAMPVTNHVEMDDNPVWSPDGQWIAFVSNRSGNNDIYIVPTEGGQSRRLTWHTGSDVPSDWSPDGRTILFAATRDDGHNGLFTLDVRTTRTNQVMLDMMPVRSPRFSPDGKRVLYNRFGFAWTRPRYEGSGAAQLWTVDLATGKRQKLRANGFQHLWSTFAAEGREVATVTVSEKTPSSSPLGKPLPKNTDNVKRTPNVYSVSTDGEARRLTGFVGGPVRFLTVAQKTGLMAFEREGEIYTLPPGGQPKKIELIASIDEKTTNEERLILTADASDVALSPKGDRMAFVVRGEIWSVPTQKGKGPNADDATQLTDYEGLDDEPVWHPDGSGLFFTSDRDGSDAVYRLDVATKTTTRLTSKPYDALRLRLTPDKRRLSFWMAGREGGLYTLPVDGRAEPTRVIPNPGSYAYGADPSYDWSPDGRYVAYAKRTAGRTVNIFLFDTQSGVSTNVTRLNAYHGTPRFSPDGRYLFFRSDRQEGGGVYALPLKAEDARETELDLKYVKPTAPVKVEVDLQDIETRARRIISQTPWGNIRVDPANGDIYFQSEGDVWKAAYTGEELRRLTTGGGVDEFEFSEDGDAIVYVKGGALQRMEIRKPNNPVTTVAFRADWTRDLRKERRAAFNEFWRLYNRSFYDPNFHARDWAGIKRRYEPFLPSVGHRNEMATLLNMMVGELEASHTEAGAGPGNPNSQNSAHPGFVFDYSYPGPGIRIKSVPPNSPGSYAKTRLSPGEIVTEINGKPVSLEEGLWRDVLNEQVGREITLTVRGQDGQTRQVKYRAMNGGDWNALLYRNRIEARRKYVEQKTGGKLTYVHIAGMGGSNYETFNQQVWEYTQGRQGVIIDVRNNGGGNISDRLIDVLERVPHSFYQDRDDVAVPAPAFAWNLPTAVLHAESSYSNAEMFPYAMKAMRLATLVGMPTPGYVIWTYGLRLVDGTNARMPTSGVYRLDGSPLENQGQEPDIQVDITPEQYFAGKDPQLDRAIEVLMAKVK